MSTIAARGLGKAYRQYPARWSRLVEWVVPFGKPRHSLKWVLQDIDFTVGPGEAVGIIGINGAGKSTLLKMIAGTTQPTTGSVSTSGLVSALLELGMGFHPDFTGRQNVYMTGQLLGLSMGTITALMPDIEAFAEIGSYIDQPVRVYSSGMQMRLAFSAATAHRPDVLIVDEALSVGDAYFQHKSFDRIRRLRKQGTTLLIVSHDKTAIQAICDRAILLRGGRIAMEGAPEAVMDYYNALLADHQKQSVTQTATAEGKTQTVSGTGEAFVAEIALLDEDRAPISVVAVGQQVTLRVVVETRAFIDTLVLGYGIRDRLGQVIYGTNTALKNHPVTDVPAGSRVAYEAVFLANLGPGTYSIQTAVVGSESHVDRNYEWRDLAVVFSVINVDKPHFTGCAWLDPRFSVRRDGAPA